MKKLLTLALALVVLAAFSGLGVAQEKKAEEKKPAPAAKEEKKAEPKKEEKKAEKPKVHSITGEVTKVDDKAKTVTIKGKDKEVTLDAAKLKKALPKTGDKVVAKYTEADGKMTAKSITAKKEEKKAEKKEEKKAEPKKEEAKPAAKPAEKK
ncbi:MAG: hypothetical protein HZA23_03225 [Nitrospirae bacterium]|nr:hypothetical protein [Nitrospirota bacterium]